ncbi:hypothetical protein PLICRDRAFT_99923 [Plicaturopsis crispa FD-325 SS-3]|nr:hypothetical protein PLICRDRAFT_99923 [Plicaturopsis crispa FD-325 SS-3]
MRRAQSVRHYGRPSMANASGADDLGVLSEAESTEDALRRELLEKDRENDKLKTQVQSLQALLAQRPPIETIQALEKEYKNLELLLAGTNRENERAMTELERGKTREKMLERELSKLAGENWQSVLDISPPAAAGSHQRTATSHSRTGTASSGLGPVTSSLNAPASSGAPEASQVHVEQVRLLILGMEQRLQAREEKLVKSVQRAEAEGARFEEMRKEVVGV